MGNIVLLDELTINQIAAGEVIERPASVIKEMVENSIDAGAKNITVEIRNGGISFIKVTDNGKGIAKDDLEIAFERHATSKIRSANDIENVTSMGFRGEALASIAAISKVEMISKTENQDIGYKIVVEAGKTLEQEEFACQNGTSITVNNLFFNTPVRYKFLKKDYTESGYIEDVITRIAIAHPEISLKLINTGKVVIQTNGSGNIKDVIYNIYGKDIVSNIIEVNYEYEDIKVKGVVGKPEIARANRTNQLFYVNSRYIKDKTLSTALDSAYKGLLPAGKFPFAMLNLEMNPSKVDVNVHPAKLEVRFQESNKVFQAVYHAVKDAFTKNDLTDNSIKDITAKDDVLNSRSLSFEERLKRLKESKKIINDNNIDEVNRAQEERKEETNSNKDEEKIVNENNPNNIIEELFNRKQNKVNDPIDIKESNDEKDNIISSDTQDILLKLKENKSSIEKELKESTKNNNSLNEQEGKYEIKDLGNDIELNIDIESDDDSDVENEKIESNILTKEDIDNIEQKKIEEEKKDEESERLRKKAENDEKIENEFSKIKQKVSDLTDNTRVVTEDFDQMYLKLFGSKPVEEKEEKIEDENEKFNASDIVDDNITIFSNEELDTKPLYKIIGIIFEKYVIIEIEKEMFIINSELANEKLIFEKLKKSFYNKDKNETQMLLLPDLITLTPKQMDIAKDNFKMFEKAGFILEEFGENTIKLTGVPEEFIDLDTKSLLEDILNEINKVARTEIQEKEMKFIQTLSKKIAINMSEDLNEENVKVLIDSLLDYPDPFTYSNEKSIAVKMSKYDIERKFSRK